MLGEVCRNLAEEEKHPNERNVIKLYEGIGLRRLANTTAILLSYV